MNPFRLIFMESWFHKFCEFFFRKFVGSWLLEWISTLRWYWWDVWYWGCGKDDVNLFSVNFVHNNSMFSMLYIRIFEKSQFYRISCVGSLTSLVNTCWISIDQMLIFEKYDVWGKFWIFIFMSYLQPLWKYSHFFFKNYLISQLW